VAITFFFGRAVVMAQYCDSAKLENNWFNWLLAKAVPDLEPYRAAGLLWTRPVGFATDDKGKPITKNGVQLYDPRYPIRHHCFLHKSDSDIDICKFTSDNGVIPKFVNCNGSEFPFLEFTKSSLLSNIDNALHGTQYIDTTKTLQAEGFFLEPSAEASWFLMITDITNMCMGIAAKFHCPSEEEQMDLAHDALYQVMRKLQNNRLIYTPGRAPVFNLLTTTIHRCMYSIMNKKKNQKNGLSKLMEDMKSGSLPTNQRSFRLQTETKTY
jgi:hypothetical protein